MRLPFQQRPVLSGRERDYRSGSGYDVISKLRCHFRLWIAVTLALLIVSCASLTQDRIQLLAAIAGQAAQLGAQSWLAKHPEQRPAFDLVIASIAAFVKSGETDMTKYTALLSSLPTRTLGSDESAGEVLLTGTRKGVVPEASFLVVYDKTTGKATRIAGSGQEQAVQCEILRGLRRAMVPMPPALPSTRSHHRPKDEIGIKPEGASIDPGFHYLTIPGTGTFTNRTNAYTLEAPPGISTNAVPSDAALDAEFEAVKARLAKPK